MDASCNEEEDGDERNVTRCADAESLDEDGEKRDAKKDIARRGASHHIRVPDNGKTMRTFGIGRNILGAVKRGR